MRQSALIQGRSEIDEDYGVLIHFETCLPEIVDASVSVAPASRRLSAFS
jgi:hypothetical protein